MKLYILGNGFDLHLGLKTGYGDFFNCKNIEKILNQIEDELAEFDNKIQRYGDVKSVLQYDQNFKNTIQKTELNIILIFLYTRKSAGITNWSDVEYQIKILLEDIRKYYEFIMRGGKTQFKKSLFDDGNSRFFDYFLVRMECLSIKDYHDVLNFIYEQLIAFEEVFSKYLEEIQSEKFEELKSEKLQNKVEDFFREGNYAENEVINILSFNYTTYLDVINNFFEETGRGKLFENLHNIHGRINTINEAVGTTIFGIDYSDFNLNKEDEISRYIRNLFSKTARVLINDTHIKKNNVFDSNLVSKNDKLEIIIFGHSLAKADYSYFQSIFDYYDLYNNNRVSICLRYTNFEKRNPLTVKSEWVEKMMNLLETYGESLDNKEHGKNLTHKLLIENRLRIEYFI